MRFVDILEVKRPMLINHINSKIGINLSHSSIDSIRNLLCVCFIVSVEVDVNIVIFVVAVITVLSPLSLFHVIFSARSKDVRICVVQIESQSAAERIMTEVPVWIQTLWICSNISLSSSLGISM